MFPNVFYNFIIAFTGVLVLCMCSNNQKHLFSAWKTSFCISYNTDLQQTLLSVYVYLCVFISSNFLKIVLRVMKFLEESFFLLCCVFHSAFRFSSPWLWPPYFPMRSQTLILLRTFVYDEFFFLAIFTIFFQHFNYDLYNMDQFIFYVLGVC